MCVPGRGAPSVALGPASLIGTRPCVCSGGGVGAAEEHAVNPGVCIAERKPEGGGGRRTWMLLFGALQHSLPLPLPFRGVHLLTTPRGGARRAGMGGTAARGRPPRAQVCQRRHCVTGAMPLNLYLASESTKRKSSTPAPLVPPFSDLLLLLSSCVRSRSPIHRRITHFRTLFQRRSGCGSSWAAHGPPAIVLS
jgi:hypothetical protein